MMIAVAAQILFVTCVRPFHPGGRYFSNLWLDQWIARICQP